MWGTQALHPSQRFRGASALQTHVSSTAADETWGTQTLCPGAMLYPESVAEESKHSITRRRFLQLSGLGAAGLLVYSGEFERHHLQITQRTIELKRLAPALDGLRIAQISDIHFE